MRVLIVGTSTTCRPHGLARGQLLRDSVGRWLEVASVPSSCEFTWIRLRWHQLLWRRIRDWWWR